ncbi:histidine kinase [Streptomyces sp. NPDC089919]|uniref:sensor histidine kinase n=1 Tax=Streptomyces sp. NPDC089919 TaxID=3155188 RepID=UPI0034461C0A
MKGSPAAAAARHARAVDGTRALRRRDGRTGRTRRRSGPDAPRSSGPGTWWRIAGEALLVGSAGLLTAFGEVLFLPPAGTGALRAVAVGLAAALLVLSRRRFPATVLLLTTALGTEAVLVYPLLCLTAWSAGRYIAKPVKATAVFTAACALAFGLTYLPGGSPSVLEDLVIPAQTLVVIVIPGLTSRYWAQRSVLGEVVAAYHAQQVRERTMAAGQARLRERQRIAQDMHDSLGHQLTLISVHLNAMDVDRTLSHRQRQSVGTLREVSVSAMRELRDVVGLLRVDGPPGADGDQDRSQAPAGVSEPLPPAPILPGAARIAGLVAASREAGVPVELRYGGPPRPLPAAVDHAVFRIAQEGLTNAHKYAPASPVTLELTYTKEELQVRVTNGPAAAAGHGRATVVSGGQGLTGLRERTRLLGGTLHAGPTPDGGFRLVGRLPYDTSGRAGSPPPQPQDDEDAFAGERGLPQPLAWELSRSTTLGSVAAACGFAGVLLLFALPTLVGLPAVLAERDSLTTSQQYDAVRPGMSEGEVRALLPPGARGLAYVPDENVPPEPGGADCLTLPSGESGARGSRVFRLCFRDGRLIEKRAFELR